MTKETVGFKLSRGVNGGIVCEGIVPPTPTPWFLAETEDTTMIIDRPGENGGYVIIAETLILDPTTKADYRFIVKACNAHDELVATLKTAKWMLERDYIDAQKMEVIDKCRALLAKVQS